MICTVEDALGQPVAEVLATLGADNAEDREDESEGEGPSDDEPSIVCTSLVGAKGLSAGHVFIVGCCNGHFPRDPYEITDNEVCSFLVGLSRTRKECHLVSCRFLGQEQLSPSAFVDWIEPHLVERTVNAAYFSN